MILDNLVNSQVEVLQGIKAITGISPEFHKLDLTGFLQLDTFFKEHDISAVIHFATLKTVGESVERPVYNLAFSKKVQKQAFFIKTICDQ